MPSSVPSNCRFMCGYVECDGLGGCETNPNYIPSCTPTTETGCSYCGLTGCSCRSCRRCTRTQPNREYCTACNQCNYCCRRYTGCVNCRNCGVRMHGANGTDCSNCHCCDECCECVSCAECGGHYREENICSSCGICRSCCDCGANGMHVQELESENTFHPANRKQLRFNKSKRFIAAEIEVDRLKKLDFRQDIRKSVKKWGGGVVHDGSLGHNGFEITTAPAAGDLFVNQIDEICGLLTDSMAVANGTCGLHVHVDARDFGWWEVRRLIKAYAKIEDALFSVVPPSRQSSIYCIRCGKEYLKRLETGFKPKECKAYIADAVYHTKDLRDMRQQKYNNARYQALNLHSWFHRGTIECRLFGGTTNATKIKNWGIFWASLLDWVYTHKDKDVEQLPANSWEALMRVCPNDEIRDWMKQRRDKFVTASPLALSTVYEEV